MAQVEQLQRYYRFHARIYGATRWTFLFGRKEILANLNLSTLNRLNLLEVGCGSGHNLELLAKRHPNMRLNGIDVSSEMLEIAQKNTGRHASQVSLYQHIYGKEKMPEGLEPPDIILFSYCLSMINPGWEAALETAAKQLKTGGRIAVVDFHESGFNWFARWMGYNHVRMDGHLIPELDKHFEKTRMLTQSAYGGLWRYFLYIGKRKNNT